MFTTPSATRSAIYWAVVVWTTLGLVGGVYYRELTKHENFTGETQLSVLHTHLLALGTIIMLVVLVLERVFSLSSDKRFGAFFWTYSGGLALTVALMTIKGTLQVLGSRSSTHPALAGMAGLGHIVITVGIVVLLMILKGRLDAIED